MSGLDELRAIYNRYSGSGNIGAKKSDMTNLSLGLAQLAQVGLRTPPLVWVSDTQVQVTACSDSPAGVMMAGFPNALNPAHFITGASDGWFRRNTTALTLDISSSTYRWGSEKSSQWYAVFALAGDSDASFTGKLMPWMRVKSEAVQVISLGSLWWPSAGIGYGFTTDELAGYGLYMISGSSAGQLRTISANNNDNGTGGTITYSGSSLSLAQGDWFIVLPHTNFRWLGDVLNNSSGNIEEFKQRGKRVFWARRPSFTFYIVDTMTYTYMYNGSPMAILTSIDSETVNASASLYIRISAGYNHAYVSLANTCAGNATFPPYSPATIMYYSSPPGASFTIYNLGYEIPLW